MAHSETPKASKGWGRVVLILSLGVNLLLVGTAVGWVLSKGPPDRDRNRDELSGIARSIGVEPFVRALTPEDRRALVRDARREADGLRENREALRNRFDRLIAAIAAEPFDEKAVSAVLADQRAAAVDRQQVGERLLLSRLTAMSPEERRAYAERLDSRFEKRRRPRD